MSRSSFNVQSIGKRSFIYSEDLKKYLRRDYTVANTLDGWKDWFDSREEAESFLRKAEGYMDKTETEQSRLTDIEARLAIIEEHLGLRE